MWRRSGTWSATSAASWPTRTAWTRRRSRRPSTSCSSPRSSSSRLPTRRWRPTETVAHPLPRRLRQIPARRRRSSKADERLRDDRTFQKVPSESHLGRKSCLNSSTFKKKDSFRKISYYFLTGFSVFKISFFLWGCKIFRYSQFLLVMMVLNKIGDLPILLYCFKCLRRVLSWSFSQTELWLFSIEIFVYT